MILRGLRVVDDEKVVCALARGGRFACHLVVNSLFSRKLLQLCSDFCCEILFFLLDAFADFETNDFG